MQQKHIGYRWCRVGGAAYDLTYIVPGSGVGQVVPLLMACSRCARGVLEAPPGDMVLRGICAGAGPALLHAPRAEGERVADAPMLFLIWSTTAPNEKITASSSAPHAQLDHGTVMIGTIVTRVRLGKKREKQLLLPFSNVSKKTPQLSSIEGGFDQAVPSKKAASPS